MPDQVQEDDQDRIYLHGSNCGVSFSIVDKGNGPCICIDGSTFGNFRYSFEVDTTLTGLLAIRNLFNDAIAKEFSVASVCPAKAPDEMPINECCSSDSVAPTDDVREDLP